MEYAALRLRDYFVSFDQVPGKSQEGISNAWIL